MSHTHVKCHCHAFGIFMYAMSLRHLYRIHSHIQPLNRAQPNSTIAYCSHAGCVPFVHKRYEIQSFEYSFSTKTFHRTPCNRFFLCYPLFYNWERIGILIDFFTWHNRNN